MRKILIPIFDNRISSRLDCTDTFQVVEIKNNVIQNSEMVRILTKNEFEKLKTILSIKPNKVICNGLTEFYEHEFEKNDIKVIPWVYGEFEDVVNDFMNGTLVSKVGRN